ncbi:MAG: DUF2330 domain-containing protein [Myxococcota bacterium]
MISRRNLQRLMLAFAVLGTSVAGLTAYSADAQACGGTFCNQNQPVNQAAENIIFSQNDDGTVTAVVQIMYQGPSDSFAWLLPVNGTPEVGVSSSNAINRLQSATAPQFNLTTTVEGECAQQEFDSTRNNGAVDAGTTQDAAAGSDAGVTVVDEGTVGPYDYTTISVNPEAQDPAQDAIDWLTDNDYDLMGTGPDLIRDYLEDGMNLIAFKLTKSATTGDIRPVSLTYPAELPMIPIKLTAVAANSNMGVRVWVLGGERAVPSNYKSLELNWAAINWLQRGSNYEQVVTQAADEANGQGFVTEYARDASTVDQVIWSDREQTNWDDIDDAAQWDGSHGDLVMTIVQRYRQFDGMIRAVDQAVPLPADMTAAEFVARPWGVYGTDDTMIDGFSPQVFLDAVQENVIDPMVETEALIDSQPYISRLYTTMSAAEMTVDPLFDFNATLEDIDNVHEAERTIFCSPHVTRSEAPWKTVLPDGREVYGTGSTWPIRLSDGAPASEEIRQDNNMDDGEVVEDNTDEIDDMLDDNNDDVSLEPTGSGGNGGGCSTAGDTAPAGLLAGLALLLGFGRVRRRR